jgi:hypothetical protein
MNRKTPKKRNTDKRVLQYINSQPCMELAGSNVSLKISSRCCEIKTGSNETIARHDMPRISFASGGDAVSYTFVETFVIIDFFHLRKRLTSSLMLPKMSQTGGRVTYLSVAAITLKTSSQLWAKHLNYDTRSITETKRNFR